MYKVVYPPSLSGVVGWAVWYGDSSRLTSDDVGVDEVPDTGVQAVVYYQKGPDGKVRRYVHCGILDDEAYGFYGRVLLGSYLGTLDEPGPYDALKLKIHKDSWLPATT